MRFMTSIFVNNVNLGLLCVVLCLKCIDIRGRRSGGLIKGGRDRPYAVLRLFIYDPTVGM